MLLLGPFNSFGCPGCQARLGVPRLRATLAVLATCAVFPLGFWGGIFLVDAYQVPGLGILVGAFGALVACAPIDLWYMLSVKLVER